MDDQVSPNKYQLEVASQWKNLATLLFQTVGKSTRDCSQNVFISPFSVAALLSMAHAGAKGSTALQLKQALGLTKLPEEEINTAIGDLIRSMKGDENFVLKAANLLYVAENFLIKKEFQADLEKHFGASAERVNFEDDQTRKKINGFVEKFTNEKILNLFPENSLSRDTRMVLVNAIYFKGDWLEEFDSKLTHINSFYLGTTESKVDVQMMQLTRTFRTGKVDELDARFIELRYKGEKTSMLIILPNKIDGLLKVEENLTGIILGQMDTKAKWKKMRVQIPKFKIESSVQLIDPLSEMGVKDLFSSDADLTGISDSGLFVTSVVQKCFIEVDEKGTEAAAATGMVMCAGISKPIPEFKVDRPAVFILRDDATKLILFIGRLADPVPK